MSSSRRYPGPKPFVADQASLFFGRDQEKEVLLRMVEDRQLTVLYGQSGLGKSSLLNVAILPEMQQQGYHLIQVRLGANSPDNLTSPLRNTVQAIADEEGFLAPSILDELVELDNSLWYFAKSFHLNSHKQKLLIVFDQFEELFTYEQRDIEDYVKNLAELLNTSLPQRYRNALESFPREEITADVAERLFEPMEVKVIFGIRSNRYHLLERLTTHLPNILRNNLELQPLQAEGARAAITRPASRSDKNYESEAFHYDDDVIADMLSFLTIKGRPIGGTLLQILCAHIEKELVIEEGHQQITKEFLPPLARVIDDYYHSRVRQFLPVQQRNIRRLIEDGLVQETNDGGMRLSMHQAQIEDRYRLSEEVLETLVEEGLLRREPYLRGGVTYELTHDSLLEPILKSKATFQEQEAQRLKEQVEEEKRLRAQAEELQRTAEEQRKRAEEALAEAQRQQQIATEERTAKQEAVSLRQLAEKRRRRAYVLSVVAGLSLLVAAYFALQSNSLLKETREQKAIIDFQRYEGLIDRAAMLDNGGYSVAAEDLLKEAEVILLEHSLQDTFLGQEERLDSMRAINIENLQQQDHE